MARLHASPRFFLETALPAGIAQAQVDSPVPSPTADDVAALSVFPYCACTDYNCAADAYTLSNVTITPGTPTVNMCFNLSYVSVGTLCARAAQDPLHGCSIIQARPLSNPAIACTILKTGCQTHQLGIKHLVLNEVLY